MAKKLNIEESFQNYDERLFAKKLVDTVGKAIKGFQCCSTNFLDPAEQEIAFRIIKEFPEVYHKWAGGFEEAERRVLVFAPEEWLFEEWDEVVLLKLSWNSKYSRTLSHRDVLGSLMGLGIEREVVGDIKVGSETAYITVLRSMSDFILMNLEKIGSAPIKSEICDKLEEVEDRYKEIRGTVASCRLDAVIAEAFNLSRNEAQEIIRAGKVRLNHKSVESISSEVAVQDLMSVKGYGRARLCEINGKTKKDRQSVMIKKYL